MPRSWHTGKDTEARTAEDMNTFGSPSQRFVLVDPRKVRSARIRFRRDALPMLGRANSFWCPAGKYPSRGWLLLPRYEYDQLDKYATNLQLTIGNLTPLMSLAIVQASCVTTGLSANANALYLIEVTDARGILSNEWFQFPTITSYNIRAPAYPQQYYAATLNAGAAWTWSGMIGDLWTQMSARLGAFPGLPNTPSSTPEGWWFPGISAWEALCGILAHLGMVVACDLTSTTPYTIVSAGATDVAFTALQEAYACNLEDELEWIDVGAGRVPKTVIVLFGRRNSLYGTEETVRLDTQQWSANALYSVSVTAPAAFASAIGKHFIKDDFTLRYDVDGNPLATDVAVATTIASARVSQYFAKIYSSTDGFMSQTYAGALPFKTGSQVDGVAWRQDFMEQGRQGWKTHIVQGPRPPWPGMWGDD